MSGQIDPEETLFACYKNDMIMEHYREQKKIYCIHYNSTYARIFFKLEFEMNLKHKYSN